MVDPKDKNKLVTSGNYGYIGATLSAASSIKAVFAMDKKKLENIHIPNMQHRTDIEKSVTKRYETLDSWGWFDED